MQEKYGFIYIWRDNKKNKYYLGSHWGTETDGYICSSTWMRNAYNRRPQDFKRKIIEILYERKNIRDIEEKWLSLIKEEELGKKYYNLCKYKLPHWSDETVKRLTIAEKISKHHKEDPNFGKWNIGRSPTEEVKKKISESTSVAMKKHYKENPRTEETRKKISENNKRLQAEKKIGMHGRKHKNSTIDLMKQNNAMNNPEYRNKVKASKQGIKWLKLGNSKKMAVPGTEKYNILYQQGYRII